MGDAGVADDVLQKMFSLTVARSGLLWSDLQTGASGQMFSLLQILGAKSPKLSQTA